MDMYNSYKFETGGALAAFVAMVHGTNAGGCVLAGGQNAAGFAGFTTDSLPSTNPASTTITLKRGRCRAIASGAITHGHWVRISNNSGQVEDCQTLVDSAPGVASNCYVIGKAETDAVNAGDQVIVITMEFVAKTAVS